MKSVENLKGLQNLFAEKDEKLQEITKVSTAKASRAGQKRHADDIEYKKACMRPVDLYSSNLYDPKPSKRDSNFRHADNLEITQGKKLKGGRKVIKIKMIKDKKC
ncbi:MAG: hypothetical protein J7L77_09590 [Clostridiales bacterium]|nr:hypothetical protein [Clostridiales bacterium]